MSKVATKSTLCKVHEILGISESYKAPETLMNILKNEKEREDMFFKFLEAFDYDLSYEWFYDYFESEHADRKNRKQDFTPTCLSKLMAEMLNTTDGIINEPAAGTGSTIISHWWRERSKSILLDFNPLNYLYICEELTDKTIPFLLCNLMIRGMNAVVIHGNTLTREAKAVYHCLNITNDPMGFSDLYELPKNERTEKMFGIKFVTETRG